MTVVCQAAFGAVGKTATAPAMSLPFLRREWAARSWRSRIVGGTKSLSYSWRVGAQRTGRTVGPGEPPDEPEIASCMSDTAFWILLVH